MGLRLKECSILFEINLTGGRVTTSISHSPELGLLDPRKPLKFDPKSTELLSETKLAYIRNIIRICRNVGQ